MCFFRHIGVFGFFLYAFLFSHLYSGWVRFIFIGVGSALGVATFDPFYYIYIFEISFLLKPVLGSSSCQDIGREEEGGAEADVAEQKGKREKGKKKKKRENHNVLLSSKNYYSFEQETCLWARVLG